MKPSIAILAKGKWMAILPACGVDAAFLINRHGPCPMCAGKDRFRFDDKGRGMWFCNQCGSGDGVSLVMKINDWDFKQAAREIEKHVGAAPVIAIRQGPDPETLKREMNDIWAGGGNLRSTLATSRWWMRRIGDVPAHPDLRAVRSLFCPGQGSYPGMVALIRDLSGKAVNMHRTFLNDQGKKADIPEPRRVMPLPLPKGCCVRLGKPSDVLGVAEGIETAVAVQTMFHVPCWAALTAQNMKDWTPPDGVRVIVFGDNDKSLTGHAASYALAQRLRSKSIEVEVRIPDQVGDDWNDVLMAQMRVGEREPA